MAHRHKSSAVATVIKRAGPLCLYSKEGLSWLEENLAIFIPALSPCSAAPETPSDERQLAPPTTIIVHLSSPSSDEACPVWAAELEQTLLLEELATRIYRVQTILAAIATGSQHWVFISRSSCHGSLWELALACQQRLWFDEHATLGFPDLKHHAPPVSLLLADPLAWQDLRQLEPWQKNALLSASQAERQGFVDFLAAGAEPLPTTQRWLATGNPQQPRSKPKQGRISYSPPPMLDFATVVRAEKRWLRHKKNDELGAVDADFASALHKARRQFADEAEFANLCYYGLARYYLSDSYRLCLQDLVAPLALVPPGREEAMAGTEPGAGLCFDTSQGLPPISMVESLLRAGRSVTFVALNPKTLASGLERTYLKLERRLPQPLLQDHWQQLISWYVGPQLRSTALVVVCDLSAQINLSWQGSSYRFINLQGNQLGAERGIWEFLPGGEANRLPDELLGLICPHLCLGIVSAVPHHGTAVAVSTWLRSHFLDELLRLSCRLGAELAKVLGALEACGWGFAATASHWGRFLQSRHSDPSELWPAPLAAYSPDQAHADLGSWKQACQVVERSKSSSEELWHATGVSFHMALYAAALSHYLRRAAYLEKPEHSELFVSKAFELPKAYGTPSQFSARWGAKRFHNYWGEQWPTLATPGSGGTSL